MGQHHLFNFCFHHASHHIWNILQLDDFSWRNWYGSLGGPLLFLFGPGSSYANFCTSFGTNWMMTTLCGCSLRSSFSSNMSGFLFLDHTLVLFLPQRSQRRIQAIPLLPLYLITTETTPQRARQLFGGVYFTSSRNSTCFMAGLLEKATAVTITMLSVVHLFRDYLCPASADFLQLEISCRWHNSV